MFDHKGDDLFVSVFAFCQTQLTIDGFTCTQNLARRELHFCQQLTELLLCQWRRVVVYLFKLNVALPEQTTQVAAFRSSWFFVNGYLVFHFSLRAPNLGFGLLIFPGEKVNPGETAVTEIFLLRWLLPQRDPPRGCRRRYACPFHSAPRSHTHL